jgi:hypothetical protein
MSRSNSHIIDIDREVDNLSNDEEDPVDTVHFRVGENQRVRLGREPTGRRTAYHSEDEESEDGFFSDVDHRNKALTIEAYFEDETLGPILKKAFPNANTKLEALIAKDDEQLDVIIASIERAIDHRRKIAPFKTAFRYVAPFGETYLRHNKTLKAMGIDVMGMADIFVEDDATKITMAQLDIEFGRYFNYGGLGALAFGIFKASDTAFRKNLKRKTAVDFYMKYKKVQPLIAKECREAGVDPETHMKNWVDEEMAVRKQYAQDEATNAAAAAATEKKTETPAAKAIEAPKTQPSMSLTPNTEQLTTMGIDMDAILKKHAMAVSISPEEEKTAIIRNGLSH